MPSTRSNFSYSKSSGGGDADYSPYGFLIVDDEPGIKDLVADFLRGCRAKNLFQAENGEQAIGILSTQTDRVDILISDCNMAPVHGLQLLKTIRDGKIQGVPADLPVILLTGHSDAPVVKKAMELKVSGFLAKPVSIEKLTAAIQKALKLGKG